MREIDFSENLMPEQKGRLTRQELRKVVTYIQSKVTLLDVAHHFNLSTRGHPGNILCWFHSEDRPSARINLRKKRYYCYAGCGFGDILWVVKKLVGLESVGQSIDYIDSKFNLRINEQFSDIQKKTYPVEDERRAIRKDLVKCEAAWGQIIKTMAENIPKWIWYHFEIYEGMITQEGDFVALDLRHAKDLEDLARVKDSLKRMKEYVRGILSYFAQKVLEHRRECFVSVSSGGNNGKNNRHPEQDEPIFRSFEEESAEYLRELEKPLAPKDGSSKEKERAGNQAEKSGAQESPQA